MNPGSMAIVGKLESLVLEKHNELARRLAEIRSQNEGNREFAKDLTQKQVWLTA